MHALFMCCWIEPVAFDMALLHRQVESALQIFFRLHVVPMYTELTNGKIDARTMDPSDVVNAFDVKWYL